MIEGVCECVSECGEVGGDGEKGNERTRNQDRRKKASKWAAAKGRGQDDMDFESPGTQGLAVANAVNDSVALRHQRKCASDIGDRVR